MSSGSTKINIGAFIIVVLVMSIYIANDMIDGPEKKRPESSPKEIAELHKNIVSVVRTEDATEIIVGKESVWNEAAVVFGLAADANEIAEKIQKHFPDIKTPVLRFTAEVPMQDKYGNESSKRFIALNYKTEDIYKINYSQEFMPQQFLNLYESSWHIGSGSRSAVAAFCAEKVGKYAHTFCRREL